MKGIYIFSSYMYIYFVKKYSIFLKSFFPHNFYPFKVVRDHLLRKFQSKFMIHIFIYGQKYSNNYKKEYFLAENVSLFNLLAH